MLHDTIIAHCTPSGSGALALIRISGPDAFLLANICAQLSSKKKLTEVESHTIHHGWVINSAAQKLDEVIFFAMKGPKTFTGEDIIEITCHNNSFIIEAIIEQCIQVGMRLAQAGEFTRQAVENGKYDLLQAEAIHELISAQSREQVQQSLAQLSGSFSHCIQQLEHATLHILALCEASFEFLDEEMDFSSDIATKIDALLATITSLKYNFDKQQQLREGMRIALIGSVNAGKSSLFNALLGKNRAIVTPIAGTTRDSIEAHTYEYGTSVTFVDTAGLRITHDIVEKEGIERSYQEAEKADLILLVIDTSRECSSYEQAIYYDLIQKYSHKLCIINTKADLPTKTFPSDFCGLTVSVQTLIGIENCKIMLKEKLHLILQQGTATFLLNKRHYTLLTSFEQELLHTKTLCKNPCPYELISHHITQALAYICELTGKSITEKTLDTIFSSFCIGK